MDRERNSHLGLVLGETQRRLLLTLHAPADQPALEQALGGAALAVLALGRWITEPDFYLRELCAELTLPTSGSKRNASSVLWRRLAKYPAWRLVLTITEEVQADLLAAIGAEIVNGVLEGRPFPPGRANRLRELVEGGVRVGADPLVSTILHEAEVRFSASSAAPVEKSQPARVMSYYRARLHYSGEHTQQARASHRALESSQFIKACEFLRGSVEDDDPRAILHALVLLTGLNIELTRSLPLLSRWAGDWTAAIDIESGLYLFDLNAVAPHARRARGAGSVAANRVVTRPLPRARRAWLRGLQQEKPAALTVDEMLDAPEISEADLLSHSCSARIKPTLARAGNTVERFCVAELGMHRVLAAFLSGRFETVSHSKTYYTLLARDIVWQAAGALFDCIGWGAPVPLVAGLPVGALGVPTDQTMQRWFAWMSSAVEAVAPGRNAGLGKLIEYHNTYTRAAASLLVFVLASRSVARLPITADVDIDALVVGLLDKRSPSAWAPDGRSAGPHPTPFAKLARYQIELYRRHCKALARRLRRFESFADAAATLERIGACAPVELLVQITHQGEIQPVGSSELVRWWPEEFSLAENFGRAYWQTRLVELGVSSRAIDRLMRHVTQGEHPLSSDSGDSPLALALEVVNGMNAELARLGVEPLRGIVA